MCQRGDKHRNERKNNLVLHSRAYLPVRTECRGSSIWQGVRLSVQVLFNACSQKGTESLVSMVFSSFTFEASWHGRRFDCPWQNRYNFSQKGTVSEPRNNFGLQEADHGLIIRLAIASLDVPRQALVASSNIHTLAHAWVPSICIFNRAIGAMYHESSLRPTQ